MLDPLNSRPLYLQLADHLRLQIETGAVMPGERLAPEPEIAEQFGLARGTVRQALDLLMREGLLQRVQGKGTFVTEQHKLECEKMIGLVEPFLRDTLSVEILRGAEKVFRLHGYGLIYGASEGSLDVEREQIEQLQRHQICGLILMPVSQSNEAFILSLSLASDLPLVVVDREIPGYSAPGVFVDDRGGASVAVEHLLSLGHQKIACITHKDQVSSTKERVSGYEEAMRAAGLLPLAAIPLEWPGPTQEGHPPTFNEAEMEPIERLLQSEDCPTALFCVNDFMAYGVMQYVLKRGLKIPQDIAIVGFDDIPLASFMPVPLTTVAQPGYEIGRRAAQLLLDILLSETKHDHDPIILPTSLVIRASTDPGQSNEDEIIGAKPD